MVGRTVVVQFRLFGLWWLNAARIVARFDSPREGSRALDRFGFAYGTLPCHVECGEERFEGERLDDDSVGYLVRASSRPRFWLARLAKPWVRKLQRRFVRDSQAAMVAAVAAAQVDVATPPCPSFSL